MIEPDSRLRAELLAHETVQLEGKLQTVIFRV
jgi:hypothetical protein